MQETFREMARQELARLKAEYNKPDGPPQWLKKCRAEIEAKIVYAIGEGDAEMEATFRAMLELHDYTVLAVRCVVVYEQTVDLAQRALVDENGKPLSAAEWYATWLRENAPQKRR